VDEHFSPEVDSAYETCPETPAASTSQNNETGTKISSDIGSRSISSDIVSLELKTFCIVSHASLF